MDLTYEEVESLINSITLGRTVKNVEDGVGQEVLLVLTHPTSADIQTAEFFKKKAIEFGKTVGLPSVSEMETTLVKRGFWGDVKDKEVTRLRKSLIAQEAVLAKTTRVPMRRDRILEDITTIKEALFSLQSEKERWLEHTFDRKAEEEKLLYLTWACTLNPVSGKKHWPTFDDFKKEKDAYFRRNVALEFTIFSVGLPMKTVRYVARSSLWSIRYSAAQKNGGDLFSRAVYDYSVDMIHLMYWSTFYNSLHEMMPEDRPDENIIDNDIALDKFMEQYFKKIKKESFEARAKKNAGKSSAWDHDELIVMKGNPVFEDVEFSKTPAEKARQKGDTTTVDVEEKKR